MNKVIAVLWLLASLGNFLDGETVSALCFAMAVLIVLLIDSKENAVAVKRYHAANPNTARAVTFELAVWRDDAEEVHSFTARPLVDAGAMLEFSRSGDDGTRKADAVFRMMSRMLVNDDGVKSQWAPTPLPLKGAAKIVKFRAPDGTLQPMTRAAEWTDPAKGSSRRRWDYLMFEDNDVTVDIGVISEIISDMASEATEVPTSG
jgi:hypothetical protein